MKEIKFKIKDWNNNWQYFKWDYNERWSCDLDDCQKDTLCQYIGLQDKDGIDIYTGDTLECATGDGNVLEGVVEYEWKEFCCWAKEWDCEDILWYKSECFTVVGNIHS